MTLINAALEKLSGHARQSLQTLYQRSNVTFKGKRDKIYFQFTQVEVTVDLMIIQSNLIYFSNDPKEQVHFKQSDTDSACVKKFTLTLSAVFSTCWCK